MRPAHIPRHAPPWWPEDEPWPPNGPPNFQHFRNMRGRFFRRMGCGFGLLMFFLAGSFTALFWLLGASLGLIHLSEATQPILRAAGLFILVIGLASIVLAVRTLRHTARPMGDILEAVGRVAAGDYSVRVPERGPGELHTFTQAFNSMVARLQSNDEQRRALLADVTHELRTPITVIQGNLEGILDGIYPADPPHLEAVLEETHILSRVIEDLRTLSLSESGAIKLQREPTDLAELINETAATFQSQAAQADVNIRSDVQPGLPMLDIDPTRMREILENLLSNALRYTRPGGEIRLRGWVEAQHMGWVFLSVEDTGAGITAEELPHIFDRFYKSSDSRGSGLGLAIAKSLVTAHGGEIWAASEIDRGTTITIRLPIPTEEQML